VDSRLIKHILSDFSQILYIMKENCLHPFLRGSQVLSSNDIEDPAEPVCKAP